MTTANTDDRDDSDLDAVAYRRVRIDGHLYTYDDATEDVTITRELVDIWQGKRGNAEKCMNARCIVRNHDAFPHPVLAAAVIKTRVYIIDQLATEDDGHVTRYLIAPRRRNKINPNTTVGHVVRYTLGQHDQRLIHDHDASGIGQTGTLTLRAPNSTNKGGTSHESKSRRGQDTGKNRKSLGRGERARLIAAVGADPNAR